MEKELGSEYASPQDASFVVKYVARCFCKAVRLEVCADPVDAKICHCLTCQRLHGAPMQWAAIFHKHDVRIIRGTDCLKFYNSEQNIHARTLPCKVRCSACGTPIADEGRRMWLAFPTLFDFGWPPKVPQAFRPTCHIFYGSRSVAIDDDLPKWSGHKNHSERIG
ncbi:MAG: GFA family protein [Desulfobacterales bacterium]|nr:GFA family protein [Desulfobacterales bacterium]